MNQGSQSRKFAAFESIHEASEIYRQLAKDGPDTYLPGLANSLNVLSTIQAQMGDTLAALESAQEAVQICRQLTKTEPYAYLYDLATALWSNADIRNKNELELVDALDYIDETITLFESLAEGLPLTFEGHLVAARVLRAEILKKLGR